MNCDFLVEKHLTGSLSSAGDHCSRTLDENDRLSTTLPPEAIPSAAPPVSANTANDAGVADATGKGVGESKQDGIDDEGGGGIVAATQGEPLVRNEVKEGGKGTDGSSASVGLIEPKKRFGKGQGGSGGKSSASQTRTVLGTAVTNFAKQCKVIYTGTACALFLFFIAGAPRGLFFFSHLNSFSLSIFPYGCAHIHVRTKALESLRHDHE